MNDGAERINKVQELIQSGADLEVVQKFVEEAERKFIEEATAYAQRAEHEDAIRSYLLATLLPDRAARREDLIRRTLYALDLITQNGIPLEHVECLKDARFSAIVAELKARFEDNEYREHNERLAALDSEQSLLNKNFAALKQNLQQMPPPKTEHHLAIELRLIGEEKAQKIWLKIIEQLSVIAGEVDFDTRKEAFDTTIREMEMQAIGCVGNPDYCAQIRRYVSEAEKELIDSHTEAALNHIHRNSSDLRYREFSSFKKTLTSSPDEFVILEAICKTLRTFRGDGLYAEVERLAVEWINQEGKLRYRLKAVENEAAARELISRSLKLINGHGGCLPQAVAEDFTGFLDMVGSQLTPPPQPRRQQPRPEPAEAPPPPSGWFKKSWLSRIFKTRSAR